MDSERKPPYVLFGGRDHPPEEVRAHWYQWFFQLEDGRKMMDENAEAFCLELWRSWFPGWKFSKGDFADAAKATTQPELLFNGMLGNALDIPGIGLCTPIWAIFPPPVLLLDCLILKLHVHKVRLMHRDVAH